jgi:hypothetical protein
MLDSDGKADLHRYLQDVREALLWKLEGLSEYDVRRPLVPSGTNLLGLVKHVTGVELGMFGETFGRPSPEQVNWDESDPMSDMFAFPRGITRVHHRPVPPGLGPLGRHHRRPAPGRRRPRPLVGARR